MRVTSPGSVGEEASGVPFQLAVGAALAAAGSARLAHGVRPPGARVTGALDASRLYRLESLGLLHAAWCTTGSRHQKSEPRQALKWRKRLRIDYFDSRKLVMQLVAPASKKRRI